MRNPLLGAALVSSLFRSSDCLRAIRSSGDEVVRAVGTIGDPRPARNLIPSDAGLAAATDLEREDYERRRRRIASSLPGHSSQLPLGHDSCPCLSSRSLAEDEYISPEGAENTLGPHIDVASYGIGCAAHDVNSTVCRDTGDCATATPLEAGCGKSWCFRPWCYVDRDNCDLLHRPAELMHRGGVGGGGGGEGRDYSYATCGFMDFFTYEERLTSLRNKTLRVAFNSNTGGWKGAQHPDGNFAPDGDGGEGESNRWEGPVVNFFRQAAVAGGFDLNVTRPPEWLRNQSGLFFGQSNFDFCVYATSLGYLDVCVASYTISAKRASVTPFFETAEDAVFLVVFSDEGGGTSWDDFMSSFLTVFSPFTLGSWLMIWIFCLPVLGLLMLYHEKGATGSAFPQTNPVMLQQRETGEVTFEVRKVPAWRHIVSSLYMGFLAFFQESYNQTVVTWGGKINLLAISSFVLLVLNVYTANLAAILTDNIAQGSVDSIDGAVKAGYNFCSERKTAETVMGLYDISPDMIVPDPVDIGGDGKVGFDCPDCKARTRVFEYMRQTHDDGSLYCNAALASREDLEVLQASGEHCDKARVGEVLVKKNAGIPIFEGVSAELMALLYQVKNDGVMAKELIAAEPTSQCPAKEEETNSLSIQQLTGIWIFSFSFAFVGLVAKLLQSCYNRRQARATTGVRVRPLQRYDQWGNPTSHDIFIDGRLYDPDAVRELHVQDDSSSRGEATEDGGGQDSSDELALSSAVCRNRASILQGTFHTQQSL